MLVASWQMRTSTRLRSRLSFSVLAARARAAEAAAANTSAISTCSSSNRLPSRSPSSSTWVTRSPERIGSSSIVPDGEPAPRARSSRLTWTPSGTMLLLPMRSGDRVTHVLLLGDREGKRFEEEQVEMAEVFAAAASAALAQLAVAEEHSAQVARQAALARAAKTLNESLDLNRVLLSLI